MLACMETAAVAAEAFPWPEVCAWLLVGCGCSKGRDSRFFGGAAGRSAKTAFGSGSGDFGMPS